MAIRLMVSTSARLIMPAWATATGCIASSAQGVSLSQAMGNQHGLIILPISSTPDVELTGGTRSLRSGELAAARIHHLILPLLVDQRRFHFLALADSPEVDVEFVRDPGWRA